MLFKLVIAILPVLAYSHFAFDHLCTDTHGHPISSKPFRKPGDCNHFYQCSNGHLSTQPCGPGTVFNPALHVCDFPYNVPGCGLNHIIACENAKNVKATCPSGSVIIVHDGYYGRDDGTTCPHSSIKTTSCSADGSLAILKKSCNGKNSCLLEPTNGVFGDPCYGTYKYIEMNYFCKPVKKPSNWHKTTVCEHDSKTLSCPSGQVIFVKKGYYGRDDGTTCPSNSIKTTDCAADGSLGKLRASCNGKNSCTVTASNSVFGDPCVGTFKYIEMIYLCHVKKQYCVDSHGNPTSGRPFQKPGDCNHFYQCSNGILHTLPCAPGTAFNPVIGVCDWPYNVPGCH